MATALRRGLVLRVALAEAGRAALGRVRRFRPGLRPARRPERLLFAPQDLRRPDPSIAADIAAGLFARAARAEPDGSRDGGLAADMRLAELHGLGWLRHLRSDDPAVRDGGRALVADLLLNRPRILDRGPGAELPVVARRLSSMLAHSPRVLAGAEHRLYRAYLGRIARDTARLRAEGDAAPRPLDRLLVAISLCLSCLSCAGYERGLRRASRTLATELDAQILPDGGHLGRNPADLLDILLELLPLRLLFATRTLPVPPALDGAIDRMLPMLRFFQHGSGDLALFNGMGRTPSPELAAILGQDRTRAAPAPRAAASGYDRLEAGRTLVLVETGAIPPLPASVSAAAGCLSFELSSGSERIVVNCGAPASPGWLHEAARATVAHSTLTLDESSSAGPFDADPRGWAGRFLQRRFGPVLLCGPTHVGAERGQAGDDTVLTAHHDGFLDAFGTTHNRRLRLSADGREFEGEDSISISAAFASKTFEALLCFHLHPSVRAESEEASGGILLTLPNGERWRFGVQGTRPRLAESVLFAVAEGRRPTLQIVVPMPRAANARNATLRWIFVRS